MKKLLCLALALCMSASLMACSNKNNDDTSSLNSDSSSVGEVSGDVSGEVSGNTSGNATGETIEAGRVVSMNLVSVTGDSVNVRDLATTDGSKVLGKALAGEYYELLEELESWYKIDYKGTNAYITSDFSKIVTLTAAEAEAKLNPSGSTSDTSSASNDD